MEVAADSWRCDQCHTAFQFSGNPPDARCPDCGSPYLTRFITLRDTVRLSVSEHLRLKGKNPSLPSKRKRRREVRSGQRPEGSGSGKLVDEWRLADADSDEYEERIVDVQSGEVIREVKEPLSRHRGGTEKRKGLKSDDG